MEKLVAPQPDKGENWPPVTLLDQPAIEQAEQAIIAQVEGIGLDVFSPWYNRYGQFRRLKHIVCRAPGDLAVTFEKGYIQELERSNADFYNQAGVYGDDGGFVIQIARQVTDATDRKNSANDQKRWKTALEGTKRKNKKKKEISLDPDLIGTVYVEIFPEHTIHPSLQPRAWGYVDIICSAQDDRFRRAGIGMKLMQLALLGLMRRGIAHVALNSVRTAVVKYADWGFQAWTHVSMEPRLTLMVMKSIMDGWNRMQLIDRWFSRPAHERKEYISKIESRRKKPIPTEVLWRYREGVRDDTEQESDEEPEDLKRNMKLYEKYRERQRERQQDSMSYWDWRWPGWNRTGFQVRTKKRVRRSTKAKHIRKRVRKSNRTRFKVRTKKRVRRSTKAKHIRKRK